LKWNGGKMNYCKKEVKAEPFFQHSISFLAFISHLAYFYEVKEI